MLRLLTVVLATSALAVGVGGNSEFSASAPAPKPTTHKVEVRGMQFVPASVNARVGDTIVWHNADVLSHTATSVGKRFDTKEIKGSSSGKWVVSGKTGVIAYLCAYHSSMRGKIVVTR